LTAFDELEMLDRIGHIHLVAVETGLGQGAIEQPAGRADERMARAILLIAGLFTDHDHPGGGRALAEHGLGGVAVQLAAATTRRRLAQLRQIGVWWHEFGGTGRFARRAPRRGAHCSYDRPRALAN